jgi:seryl-tRNA synthetase
MLDIKFIRQNSDIVKDAARKKHVAVDIDRLIALDDERLQLLQKVEEKRAEQNNASKEIPTITDATLRAQKIEEMKVVKDDMQIMEEKLKPIQEEWDYLMWRIPNVPDPSVPEGESDVDNVEVKVWGEKTKFDFEPKDHIELMLDRGMVDFERGTKVHGFRGYYLIGWGRVYHLLCVIMR